MTDLEITRLCAEAMELPMPEIRDKSVYCGGFTTRGFTGKQERRAGGLRYDPLHDDAQAMALLKYHSLDVTWMPGEQRWRVGEFRFAREPGMNGKEGLFCEVRRTDLNRAICECVAKLKQGEG